jgi:hypothetical protein
MTIKNGEYGWVWLQWARDATGIASTWKLVYGPNSARSHGFFMQGAQSKPGWFVAQDRLMIQTVATLPNSMSKKDAMEAAKMILLSLKDST